MTRPMKHIQYSVEKDSWSALPPETWYKDSKWFHGYDNSTAGNGFYYHNFWGKCVWQYDIAEKNWTALPAVLKNGSHGASLTFFPDMGNKGSLIHLYGKVIQAYDIEKKSWSYVKGDISKSGPYHNVSMYHSKRKTVLLGGGNGSKTLYELDATGKISELKPAPVPIVVNLSHFVIDPASGDLLVYNFVKGALGLYGLRLSDKTAEWTKLSTGKALGGIVVALEEYSVTMWFTHNGCWLYKHKSAK